MSKEMNTRSDGEMLHASMTAFRRDIAYYVDRVEFGECRVIITRNGTPIVALVSLKDLAIIETGTGKRRSNG